MNNLFPSGNSWYPVIIGSKAVMYQLWTDRNINVFRLFERFSYFSMFQCHLFNRHYLFAVFIPTKYCWGNQGIP